MARYAVKERNKKKSAREKKKQVEQKYVTGKNVSRLRHFISTRKGKVPSLVTHDGRSFVRFVALRKKIALGKKREKKR